MRSKEEADDYRYFPDPDLLPVVIRSEVIEDIKRQLPELPAEKASRFRLEYGLNEQDAEILAMNKEVAEYFEQTVRKTSADARRAANWVTGELNAALSVDNLDITSSPVTSDMLAGLLTRIEDGTISGKIAKEIFRSMWAGEGEADSIIESKGLRQITDTLEIELLVDQVLLDNPVQVGQFKSGKDKVFGFFVGQVMKLSKGKANPQQVNSLLRKKLQ